MSRRAAAALLGAFLTALAGPARAAPCEKPLETCLAEQRKLLERRGTLGFLFSTVDRDEAAPPGVTLRVRAAPAGYPAAAGGLKVGDYLLAMDGKDLRHKTRDDFNRLAQRLKVGQVTALSVLRDGHKLRLRITAARPDARTLEAWLGEYVLSELGEEAFREYLRRLQSSAGRAAPVEATRPSGKS